jgi:hypothetical protein
MKQGSLLSAYKTNLDAFPDLGMGNPDAARVAEKTAVEDK